VSTPSMQSTDIVERARAYRREVIEPLQPHVREWIIDEQERFPWEAVEAGSKLGFKSLAVEERFGGGGGTKVQQVEVIEELAAGDMGIAVIFDQCMKISAFIGGRASDEQKERFLVPFAQDHRMLLALANNDVDHTTDWHLSRRLTEVEGRPMEMSTTAVQDGDHWVINGAKLMPSLGSTASLAVVLAQTEPGLPMHKGASYFLVPMDTPGVRVSKTWEKISQRLVDNATIVFENCRVPDANMIGGRGAQKGNPFIAGGNITAGATTIGSARGAYERAVAYARERVQGGRPIIEHQAVGMMLGEMAARLEAARSLTMRAAQAYDAGDRATPLQQMSKWFAADTAVFVARTAMEVLGHRGIMMDEPVQKHMRDCLSFLHSDGTQQGRLLLITQAIMDDRI
jgi:butyryl-CoA dehydrogenase